MNEQLAARVAGYRKTGRTSWRNMQIVFIVMISVLVLFLLPCFRHFLDSAVANSLNPRAFEFILYFGGFFIFGIFVKEDFKIYYASRDLHRLRDEQMPRWKKELKEHAAGKELEAVIAEIEWFQGQLWRFAFSDTRLTWPQERFGKTKPLMMGKLPLSFCEKCGSLIVWPEKPTDAPNRCTRCEMKPSEKRTELLASLTAREG